MATQSRIWLFVNSSVGLLLIAFLLTTVLGALLTYQIEEAALEHNIRFSALQKDRAIAIKEIYQKIVGVELTLKERHKELDSTNIKEAETSVRELRRLYENSRIYFEQELSNEIGNVCVFYEDRLKDINNRLDREPIGGTNIYGLRDTANAMIGTVDTVNSIVYINETGKVKRKLEGEFRKILGVKVN